MQLEAAFLSLPDLQLSLDWKFTKPTFKFSFLSKLVLGLWRTVPLTLWRFVTICTESGYYDSVNGQWARVRVPLSSSKWFLTGFLNTWCCPSNELAHLCHRNLPWSFHKECVSLLTVDFSQVRDFWPHLYEVIIGTLGNLNSSNRKLNEDFVLLRGHP